MKTDPEILSYSGPEEGPHLLVTGAVHGNEPCGPRAIRRVLSHLDSGDIALDAGRVSFIPVCNPAAREQNQRFVEHNLNRHLYPKQNPHYYEDHLANALCPHLSACDILLDLHSYQRGGPPFIFLGPHNAQERAFARMLGVPDCVYGFQDAYRAAGVENSEKASMGTTEYTRTQGGIGLTLECGQHDDPAAAEIAFSAILGALHHLQLAGRLEAVRSYVPARRDAADMACTQAQTVVYKQRAGTLTRDWQHLAPVRAGEAIARYDDGETIRADDDGRILMPHPNAPAGQEWFYLGRTAVFEE